METIIRVKYNELTLDFLNKIKELFKNEDALEISISPVTDFGLTKREGRKEYITRINKAIKNLEEGKGTVSLSEDEFETLANDLLTTK
jgi:hypothetical protein